MSLRQAPAQGEFRGQELFLGDLAICHQKVISQADEFNISYFDEFIHLLFHGVIHLVGYDHEISLKEEKIMELWEEKALSLFSKAKKKGA
jgi:probable rRNA maturation factor